MHYPNTGQNIQQIIFYDLVFSPETQCKLPKLFLIFFRIFRSKENFEIFSLVKISLMKFELLANYFLKHFLHFQK